MFKNYLKIAGRNLGRHKSNAFINIAGLMVGFAAFLLIFLVVQYEKSFEDFNANKNELYRVVRIGRNERENEYRTGVPFPVTQTLRIDLPQLKNAAAIFSDNNVQVNITGADGSIQKKFKEKYTFCAEPQFFQMFNFPLVEGNINTALNDANTVLLTKDVASKYFGDWHAAMNKTINLYGLLMKVTGILEDPPANTDFPLTVVVSYATITKYGGAANDWGSISDKNYCLVQLNKNASVSHFNQLLDQFTTKHIKPVNPNYDLSLQPLKKVHYDERYGNFTGRTFSRDLIFALSLIGIFLLVIACVNFINITTAQAVNRAREVGVRKVLGSSRKQLIWQFLGETGITTICALTGSVIIAILCLPAVNSLLDIHLATTGLFNAQFVAFIILAFLVVTILSGFYPALILSGFKSINVLKSTFTINNKGISLRRALVVFQFVIAQALIIGTLIVGSQMNYFRNADMGFNQNAIINAGIPGDSLNQTKMGVLYSELSKINGVQRVSFSAFAPSADGGWYTDLINGNDQKENSPHMIVSMKPADTGYFDLYNLKLIAGRVYFPSDTMREFVVNEAITKNLGYQDAHNAIGKLINVNGKLLPIVGVVKNFHAYSLRDSIGPVVLTTMKNAYGLANIKIDMKKAKLTIASIQNIYSNLFPDFIFEYNFLDQTIADYYKQENELSILYKIFSGIAIFISCLGLYGLVSFMAVQRRKEIGIRKVLGAPVRDIVIMLSKEFTVLIVIAFLIASPLAWYYMHQWLQQFTYRIMIGVWFFAATILCALIIAWLTVGYTAIKAAIANPVNSLRSE